MNTAPHELGFTPIYGRRCLNYVPSNKVPAFVNLFDALASRLGSEAKALKASDLSTSTLYGMRQENVLTDKQAHKLLAAYKRSKQ